MIFTSRLFSPIAIVKHNIHALVSNSIIANYPIYGQVSFTLSNDANLLILINSRGSYNLYNVIDHQIQSIDGVGTSGFFGLNATQSGNRIQIRGGYEDDTVDLGWYQYGGGSGENSPLILLSNNEIYSNGEQVTHTVSDECTVIIVLCLYNNDTGIGNHVGRPYVFYKRGNIFVESEESLLNTNQYIGMTVNVSGNIVTMSSGVTIRLIEFQ